MWLFFSCKNTTKPVYLSCRVSDITTMCFLSLLPPKRGNDGSSFNEDQLIAYLLDLHFAGTDTTANTVLFAILFMMTYPEVQGVYSFICHHFKKGQLTGADTSAFETVTRCPSDLLCFLERFHREVDRVLDGKDQISFEDRHQMPYVQVLHFESSPF